MTGTQLGEYRILDELPLARPNDELDGAEDADQTCRLYEAVTAKGDQAVLISLLPSQVARDRLLWQCFRETLLIVSRLRHPNLLPILSAGVAEGSPFLVMPLPGLGRLEDRYQAGTLSAVDVGQVIGDIAGALDYAHQRGVVHGDLAPADIFFNETGTALVANLGLASVLRPLWPEPEPSNGNGHRFRAPEVTSGNPMTPAADQFSLALIALELLTRRPAKEARHALGKTHPSTRDRYSKSSTNGIQLPLPVAAVLLRALDEDPARRFPSVAAMNQALQVALGLQAPSPTPNGEAASKPSVARKRRSPRVVLASSLALVCCLLLSYPAVSSGQLVTAWRRIVGRQEWTPTPYILEPIPLASMPIEARANVLPTSNLQPSSVAAGPDASLAVEPVDASAQPLTTEPSSPLPSGASDKSAPSDDEVVETAAPSSTPSEPPTATPEPSAAPSAEPSVNPHACKDDPERQNYCTPTP